MSKLTRIRRVPILLWYSRHELTHILIGLVFAWFLRELWGEFSIKYIVLAVIGSVLIDIDHVLYYFIYGRHELYAVEVRKFLKQGQIGTLFSYITNNHKNNTSLLSHNVYVLAFFASLSFVSFFYDWKARVVLFGAIVLHLLMDLVDDLWVLGRLNENWKRLRRKKEQKLSELH